MILRADFKIVSSSSRLISPVIFGSILDKLYEVMDVKDADEILKRMIESNVLVSDAHPSDKDGNDFLRLFYIRKTQKEKDQDDKDVSLIDKKKLVRQRKKEEKKEILIGIKNDSTIVFPETEINKPKDFYRVGVQINRTSDMSHEGIFFYHQEFRFCQDQLYSIYIKCDDSDLIDIMEKCLRLIELSGFGPDVSIGKGKIVFEKDNGKILKEDKALENNLFTSHDMPCECINISSTILTDEILNICEFKSYVTSRYDSKGFNHFKPPYFLAEAGALVLPKGANLSVVKRYKNVYIYTCVFALKVKYSGGD